MNTSISPDKQYPNRRLIRYKGYDYASTGAYFVTVCTRSRLPLLAHEVLHAIIVDVWYALPQWFLIVALDEFVIMPNHVHFVAWLGRHDDGETGDVVPRYVGGRPQGSPLRERYVLPNCVSSRLRPTLGEVVGTWKSLITAVYLRWIKENAPARHNLAAELLRLHRASRTRPPSHPRQEIEPESHQ